MLKGKIALITGGTRGIGYETVRLFKENNAEVILFGSNPDSVNKAINELKNEGHKVSGYHTDLNNYEEIEKMIKEIIEKYGRIDILINNAGISANKKLEETTSEEFAKIMNLNVNGIFNMTKAVVPYMKEKNSGVIINTSSMVSIYGQPSGVGYPTSKFAVNGITKSLSRELAPFNIRVNAVAPGITRTDMVASLKEELIAPLIKSIPDRKSVV